MTVTHVGLLYTATIFSESNAHLVILSSDGQGAYYMSANDYSYYVAMDSDNNIQALPVAEIEDVDVSKLQCDYCLSSYCVIVFMIFSIYYIG